jgi:hypothetical protein
MSVDVSSSILINCSRATVSGWNNSIGLPSGSSTWICFPPGAVSMSFRKRTPAFFKWSMNAGRSVTRSTTRFHPPGSCCCPLGIGRTRCLRTAEQNLRVTERDASERGKLLVFNREAELCRVERDRTTHVFHLISNDVHGLYESVRSGPLLLSCR